MFLSGQNIENIYFKVIANLENILVHILKTRFFFNFGKILSPPQRPVSVVGRMGRKKKRAREDIQREPRRRREGKSERNIPHLTFKAFYDTFFL